MEITLLGGNWHEKGFPVPECGVGLDSVALAYFESVLLYSVRGLAYQVCLERFKVLNRELVARPARACMGTGGRKRAASSCTRELVRVENQTQMVRSCNRAAFRHTSSIHVGCADAFFRESPSATYVDSSGLLTGTTVRASMGRDSVEGLCFEEAPTSLLSPLVCVDSRRVLGAMACSVMVADIELSDAYTLADHLRKSHFLVSYLLIPVRPKRAELASYDSPPFDNTYRAKPRIFRRYAWHRLYHSDRGGAFCVLGHNTCRKAEVHILLRFRFCTRLIMIFGL